jgi:hypothetical protein
VAQAETAPQFTIASPSYTAADGVARVGDEFRADLSVVRTSGDQSIAGVKSFGSFPLTPQSAPAADYEAANKKYVDDRDAASQLWQRVGATLSPANAGDALRVDNYAVVYRSPSNAVALALYVQGESVPRLVAQADGRLTWGDGSSYDVLLKRLAADALGLETGDAFRAGEYCELTQRGSAPLSPDSGFVRAFAKDDTRVYVREPGGVEHDLSVAHKQAFPAVGGPDGALILLVFAKSGFPVSAVLPPDFAAVGSAGVVWPTGGGGHVKLSTAEAKFSWTSAQSGGVVTLGARVAAAAVVRRYGGRTTARARIMVNNTARFNAVYLSLNDSGSNSASSASLLPGMTGGAWYDAVLSGVDVSGWSNELRVVVTVQGTTSPLDVGLTEFHVECLSVEQWAK